MTSVARHDSDGATPTATLTAAPTTPAPPLDLLGGDDDDRRVVVDLSDCEEESAAERRARDAAFVASRELRAALGAARASTESSRDDGAEAALDEVARRALDDGDGDAPRLADLGARAEERARHKAFRRFLATGTLIKSSQLSSSIRTRDEEYLGGACVGLAHDLARYAVGRAIARDARSVESARRLVDAILERLLRFDFRNGHLRRKYDGVKYALKRIETIAYELSFATDDDNDDDPPPKVSLFPDDDDDDRVSGGGPPAKKARTTKDSSSTTATLPVVDDAEFEEIRARMERRDALRETLIKRCRDAQKAAKHAVFALHRRGAKRSDGNNDDETSRLLRECERVVSRDLAPIVAEEPALRTGSSLSAVLEEYVEAKLFRGWLESSGRAVRTRPDLQRDLDQTSDETGDDAAASSPSTPRIRLSAAEYLGGLCDLTGEVGRFAVRAGTARDAEAVRRCLATNASILHALRHSAAELPHEIHKKMGPLRTSVEKIEHVLYELRLSEATAGRRRRRPAGAAELGTEETAAEETTATATNDEQNE